jgi:hypothetical protein
MTGGAGRATSSKNQPNATQMKKAAWRTSGVSKHSLAVGLGGAHAAGRSVGTIARAVPLWILLGASRAQPHPVDFAPFPSGRHRKCQISPIGTAIKPGDRLLATVSNTIAGKLQRFALPDLDRFQTHVFPCRFGCAPREHDQDLSSLGKSEAGEEKA